MQVHIESRDPQALPLRELVQRRVRFVMRRLAWLVPQATVQLSDINGPRGGIDKRCRVALQPIGMERVVITSVASDWRHALDQALARAARALLRQWRRSQCQPRSLHRALPLER
jgi:hypothetical protein